MEQRVFLNYKFFFIPFLYFLKTRIKSKIKFISWNIIYTIPIMTFSIMSNGLEILKPALIITLIYTLYELGYIYNDCETTKEEINPTLRVSSNESMFFEENKTYIYLFRTSIALCLTFLYVVLFKELSVVIIWGIIPVFYFYNNIRNRMNLLLHFILVLLRYSLPFYILTLSFSNFLFSIMLFPLINLIERASEKRFKFIFFQNFVLSNKNNGRYIYYLMVSLIFFILLLFGYETESFCLLSLFYFTFRLLSYRVIK